jgi:hypothetical protein
MPLVLFFNTQTMRIKSIVGKHQHCYDFLKKLTLWRDLNPAPLFLRRLQCPLRHAASANFAVF